LFEIVPKMNIKKTMKIVTVGFLLLLLGVSCVKGVDFDQAEDVSVQPIYELDFVYSRIRPINFNNGISNEFIPTLRDTLRDELFSGEITDKLLAVDLFVSFENSVNRSFGTNLQFLDANNVVLRNIFVNAAAGTPSNPVTTTHTIALTRVELNTLVLATKLVTAVTMSNGATDLDGILHLKSKAIYYTSLLDE